MLALSRLSYSVLTTPPRWHELSPEYSYAQYLVDWQSARPHTKAPAVGSAEYSTRQSRFSAELRDVMAHNSNGETSWKRGMNQFSDRTAAEFQRVSLSASASIKRRSIAATSGASAVVGAAPLPAAVDWREKGVLTAVKNQMSCGSCWAFASTAMVETYAALGAQAAGGSPVLDDLSPQQLVSCAPNPDHCGGIGGCDGSIPELAFDYLAANGMTSEWVMPYLSGDGKSCAPNCPCDYKTSSAVVSLDGYVKLEPANDQATVMHALSEIGPQAINVQANTWSSYESGIFPASGCGHNSTTHAPANTDIDHVVQLVGYGADYWIVRNSWSPLWGEDGFIRLARAKTNGSEYCGKDTTPLDGVGCATGVNKSAPVTTVCGTCAVLWDVSYPTGVKYVKSYD